MKKLTLLLAIIILNGCGMANNLRLKTANNNLQPQWQSEQSKVQLPTSYVGEKAYVYGSINGVDGFKFMIDSGASFPILFDTDKVKALALTPGYQLELGGWGEQKGSEAFQTQLGVMKLGAVTLTDIAAAYMPISESLYFLRKDEVLFDGVVGDDILRHFVWTFDKKHQQVTVSNQPYQPEQNEEALKFARFFGKISIDVTIDYGQQQEFEQELIIDTGSRHYLKVNTAYISNRKITLPESQVSAMDFGLSGRAPHQRVTLDKLMLGSTELAKIKTNIIPSDDEDDFSVLGNATLSQFVTTIDYKTNTLYLKPYADQPFHSRHNRLGLELRKLASGDFVVRYVFPQLPGATSDIQEGDVITSINGVKAGDISQDTWLAISDTVGEYRLCVQHKSCEVLVSLSTP